MAWQLRVHPCLAKNMGLFLAPILSSSQLPVTPVPMILKLSFGLSRHQKPTHIHKHIHLLFTKFFSIMESY